MYECIIHVNEVLHNFPMLTNFQVSLTCQKLSDVAQSNALWAALCLHEYGMVVNPLRAQPFYQRVLTVYQELIRTGFYKTEPHRAYNRQLLKMNKLTIYNENTSLVGWVVKKFRVMRPGEGVRASWPSIYQERIRVFTVTLERDNSVKVRCMLDQHQFLDECQLLVSRSTRSSQLILQVQCKGSVHQMYWADVEVYKPWGKIEEKF